MDKLALIFSCISAAGVICTIIAFFVERKKSNRADGAEVATMQSDMRYIRNAFDDLRLDVKELIRKQDTMAERQTAEEIRRANLEQRVDKLELRVDRLEQQIK